jgi:hypothetical protein
MISVDALAHRFVLAVPARFKAVAAFETEAQDAIDHFEQIEVFLRIGHQSAHQKVDLVAPLPVLVENGCQPPGNPLHARVARVHTRIRRGGMSGLNRSLNAAVGFAGLTGTAGLAVLAPGGLHGRLVERGAQAVAGAEHMVATDAGLLAQLLEGPDLLLQQVAQQLDAPGIKLHGHVGQCPEQRPRGFEQRIARRLDGRKALLGRFTGRQFPAHRCLLFHTGPGRGCRIVQYLWSHCVSSSAWPARERKSRPCRLLRCRWLSGYPVIRLSGYPVIRGCPTARASAKGTRLRYAVPVRRDAQRLPTARLTGRARNRYSPH